MPSEKEIELKPCPFCGYPARLLGGPDAQESYTVWCENPKRSHHLKGGMDKDQMISEWNRRALTAAEQAEPDELTQIKEMLEAGQGDDDGMQILPDFSPDMTTAGKVEVCLELLEKRRDIMEAFAAKKAEPAPAHGAPLGAIENGRVFLQRLEHNYDFQCEAGSLANCSDYIEALQCFEYIAEWIIKTREG